MRIGFTGRMLAIAATGLLIGCTVVAGGPPGAPAPKVKPAPDPMTEGMSLDQKSFYQQCLDNHRTVAMSWEAIQRNCRDQVMGKEPPGAARPADKQTAQ